jgi:hypothetical protein
MTVSSSSTTIIANAVTNASGYHWEFTKGGVTVFADTATRTITLAALAATNPGFITPSTTYQVRVRPQNGAVYGPSCALTTTATFSFAPTTPPNAVAAKETLLDSNVCAYPNPFDTGFQLKWDTPLTSEVHVALYDLLGHLIFQEQYTPQELENHTFAMPLAPGMYLAVIRQEGYEKSIKIIKK